MQNIQIITFNRRAEYKTPIDFLSLSAARKARTFHSSFPSYRTTPLHSLSCLARELNLSDIFVKDESYRFGLNAFKVLGGSYAIGQLLARRLGMSLKELPYKRMVSDEIRSRLGDVTFVTATDGNHGRGIAWTAHQLRQNSVVYMPRGSSHERLKNILIEGSRAEITTLSYDDSVRMAANNAIKNGWILLQDTAWDGYEEIPAWIMEGYTTMALEAYEQMNSLGQVPTHIFLQAGVGSMAAAVLGFFANVFGENRPTVIIVEPAGANCIFRTASANDGKLHFVTEEMNTIMAGLACGEPSKICWPILRDYADAFLSCSDIQAAQGMRILGAPMENDPRIISGESGAVGIGVLYSLMRDPELHSMRKRLKLNANSRVLCFSTEGDTDRKNYRKTVWDGAFPGE